MGGGPSGRSGRNVSDWLALELSVQEFGLLSVEESNAESRAGGNRGIGAGMD